MKTKGNEIQPTVKERDREKQTKTNRQTDR